MSVKAAVLLAGGLVASSAPVDPNNATKERREMRVSRVAKVERVLAAVRSRDEAALKDEGVLGVPYFLGFSRSVQAEDESPFDVATLAAFAECEPSRPSSTGIGWLTVNWVCPETVSLPWRSTSTAFKFEALAITEIRTTPGAPLFLRQR